MDISRSYIQIFVSFHIFLKNVFLSNKFEFAVVHTFFTNYKELMMKF